MSSLSPFGVSPLTICFGLRAASHSTALVLIVSSISVGLIFARGIIAGCWFLTQTAWESACEGQALFKLALPSTRSRVKIPLEGPYILLIRRFKSFTDKGLAEAISGSAQYVRVPVTG
jgi:hypothetical protein